MVLALKDRSVAQAPNCEYTFGERSKVRRKEVRKLHAKLTLAVR